LGHEEAAAEGPAAASGTDGAGREVWVPGGTPRRRGGGGGSSSLSEPLTGTGAVAGGGLTQLAKWRQWGGRGTGGGGGGSVADSGGVHWGRW
jgi:hypothetical protein